VGPNQEQIVKHTFLAYKNSVMEVDLNLYGQNDSK